MSMSVSCLILRMKQIKTHELIKILGERWAKVWLDEFCNTGTGKNTHKYLTSAGGVWSADMLSDDEIYKYDGTQATNNVSEKGLGLKTGQIQTHTMISFTNASICNFSGKVQQSLCIGSQKQGK